MKGARKMAEEEIDDKQKHKKKKNGKLQGKEDRMMIKRKCYDNCEER